MSFILDAIKKSEDERQKNRQPDIHSLQGGSHYAQPKASWLKRLLTFALSICLLVLIGRWLWPQLVSQFDLSWRPAVEKQTVEPAIRNTQSLPERASARQSGEAVSTPVQPPAASPRPVSPAQLASADELPPRHLIKEFWELPADFQSTVPDMEFSFHVFSKDPARRTIFINGRSLKEGQMIASGLKLRVITASGVIVQYRDRYFHVDVVEKW